MKKLIFALLLLVSEMSLADIGGHLLYSTGATLDRSQNQGYESLGQQGIAAGLSRGSWGFRVEGLKNEAVESEGNLALRRTRHWLTLSGLYSTKIPTRILKLEGFLGFGLGGFQDMMELSIAYDRAKASSQWNTLAQGLFGLRLLDLKPIAFEIEGRIWASQRLEVNPATAVLARFGLYF